MPSIMKPYTLIRKLLFCLPPECAHRFTLACLKVAHSIKCLPKQKQVNQASSIHVAGLDFPHRIGLAAGMDSNGRYINALASLGFAFIEVGGVTPKAQAGNDKPRLFRLTKNHALINRMGFCNRGADALVEQIERSQYKGILGVNIAKNKATPLAQAHEDYLYCFEKVYSQASYVTVNVSSPNTPNLRDLQSENYLQNLLSILKTKQIELTEKYKKYVPLFVKVAPDLEEKEIKQMAATFRHGQLDGIVVGNTSIARNGLQQEPHINEAGGVSGQPLFVKSNRVLQQFRYYLPKPFPIIACGGTMCAEDAKHKIELGADLVQLYTGLIYAGPSLITACRALL